MKHLIRTWDVKRAFHFLPDLWFLTILLLGWGEAIGGLFSGSWYALNIILGTCLLVFTVLLVSQLFSRKVILSFIMGLVFLIVSFYFSVALFSELTEFASLTELKAIETMLGGGAVVGGSIAMSFLMMIRSALK